jgi:hypothetical protein
MNHAETNEQFIRAKYTGDALIDLIKLSQKGDEFPMMGNSPTNDRKSVTAEVKLDENTKCFVTISFQYALNTENKLDIVNPRIEEVEC